MDDSTVTVAQQHQTEIRQQLQLRQPVFALQLGVAVQGLLTGVCGDTCLQDAVKQARVAVEECFAVLEDEDYDEDTRAVLDGLLDEAANCLSEVLAELVRIKDAS